MPLDKNCLFLLINLTYSRWKKSNPHLLIPNSLNFISEIFDNILLHILLTLLNVPPKMRESNLDATFK